MDDESPPVAGSRAYGDQARAATPIVAPGRFTADDFDLPAIEIPDRELTLGLAPEPLLDSSWTIEEQSRRLIDCKAYRLGGS
jgi:hypothetical protein